VGSAILILRFRNVFGPLLCVCVAGLVLLIEGSPAAKQIGATDVYSIEVSEDWCERIVDIDLVGSHIDDFIDKEENISRAIGVARLSAAVECPDIRIIRVNGVVDGAKVFQGAAAGSQGWRLMSYALTVEGQRAATQDQASKQQTLGGRVASDAASRTATQKLTQSERLTMQRLQEQFDRETDDYRSVIRLTEKNMREAGYPDFDYFYFNASYRRQDIAQKDAYAKASSKARAQLRRTKMLADPRQREIMDRVREIHEAAASKPPLYPFCGDFQIYSEGYLTGRPISLSEFQEKYSIENRRSNGDDWRSRLARQRLSFDRLCAAANALDRSRMCDKEDYACSVVARCFSPVTKPPNNECIDEEHAKRAVREQSLEIARIGGDGGGHFRVVNRNVDDFEFFNRSGVQLDWCDATLWARYQITRHGADGDEISVEDAATIRRILNDGFSDRCPNAKLVEVHVVWPSAYYKAQAARREINRLFTGGLPTGGPSDKLELFLTAYREGDVWSVNINSDWLEASQAIATHPMKITLDAMRANQSGGFAAAGMTMRNAFREIDALADKSYRLRQAEYAREGKFCAARKTVELCTVNRELSAMGVTPSEDEYEFVSSCGGECAGHEGPCDTASGRRYASWESAERDNCRAATKAEVGAALNAVRIGETIRLRPYQLTYSSVEY